MARRKNGAAALEGTEQLLAETNGQIDDLRRRRADELSGAADENALDKFDAEIKRLETLAGRHKERIALLEVATAQAEAERRVREREGLIRRIEKKTRDERQVVAGEIRDGIAKADAGLRKLLELSRDVQAAWPWQAHELAPCLLSPIAILEAISHELYRQGARPRLFGGMDTKFDAGISFPGGKSPRLELAGLPERIKPLVDVMAEAGELASNILRSGKSTAAAIVAPMNGTTETIPPNAITPLGTAAEIQREVRAAADARDATLPPDVAATNGGTSQNAAEARERTACELELETLLKRQMELAQDISPAGEAAYLAVVGEIVDAQAEVDAARGART